MRPEDIEVHNRKYSEAWRLIEGQVLLDSATKPTPNWFVRRRLRKAINLFKETIAINPSGWNAMFGIGKILQRLGDREESFQWLLKAREFAPDNTSLAKETSLTASQLGMHQMAASIADEAIGRNPRDAGLLINAGLAHICAGNSQVALERFRRAYDVEPSQEMNKKLAVYAEKVDLKQLPIPRNESDILKEIKNA